jgi:hypothetical protein
VWQYSLKDWIGQWLLEYSFRWVTNSSKISVLLKGQHWPGDSHLLQSGFERGKIGIRSCSEFSSQTSEKIIPLPASMSKVVLSSPVCVICLLISYVAMLYDSQLYSIFVFVTEVTICWWSVHVCQCRPLLSNKSGNEKKSAYSSCPCPCTFHIICFAVTRIAVITQLYVWWPSISRHLYCMFSQLYIICKFLFQNTLFPEYSKPLLNRINWGGEVIWIEW